MRSQSTCIAEQHTQVLLQGQAEYAVHQDAGQAYMTLSMASGYQQGGAQQQAQGIAGADQYHVAPHPEQGCAHPDKQRQRLLEGSKSTCNLGAVPKGVHIVAELGT